MCLFYCFKVYDILYYFKIIFGRKYQNTWLGAKLQFKNGLQLLTTLWHKLGKAFINIKLVIFLGKDQ